MENSNINNVNLQNTKISDTEQILADLSYRGYTGPEFLLKFKEMQKKSIITAEQLMNDARETSQNRKIGVNPDDILDTKDL